MSKKNKNDQQNDSADLTKANGEDKKILTVEEHRKNLNIGAPTFAAVMETKGWRSGKKVPQAVFQKAVNSFLGASMDCPKEEVQTNDEQQEDLKNEQTGDQTGGQTNSDPKDGE